MTRPSVDIPTATRHSFDLPNHQTLSYYTFDTRGEEGTNGDSDKHPVLYLHGFPGTGLEGAVCAEQVAQAKCKLYAPDRPGFGFSDPLPKTDTKISSTSSPFLHNNKDYDSEQDVWQQTFVQDLWSFVRHCGWKSFSIIGVSGGGPYTLAMINSYLDMCQTAHHGPPAKLEAVSLVAGICCSAGIDGLMPVNQQLYKLVHQRDSSFLARVGLHMNFVLPRILLKILPAKIILKLLPTKDLPAVDQDMFNDDEVAPYLLSILESALRQGATAAEWEATVLFRDKQGYEESLRHHYTGTSSAMYLPRVGLFHGHADVNVPLSHSTFVRTELLKGNAKLAEYPELGHISLVVTKAQDYAEFAAPSKD